MQPASWSTGRLLEKFSRRRGAEPPGKTLRMSTPMPREKSGLFLLYDGKTAVAE